MEMILELLGTTSGAPLFFIASILLRGAALLAIALLAALILRRAPAAVRHQAWALAMVGLVTLPVLAGALPHWRVELPGSAVLSSAAAAAVAGAGAEKSPGVRRGDPLRRAPERSGAAAVAERASPPAGDTTTAGPAWPGALMLAWAAGALLLLGRLAAGILRAKRLVRRARPVTDRRWNVLVSDLSLRCGLEENVRVVVSPDVDVPMAWGLASAWLVLPEGIESWPDERRRVVVLHELAHLRRRDCLAQALAGLALALHWPNPLAWIAERRMRSERELACDDAVLVAGVRGPAYAHHLVEIARGLSRRARPVRAAVAMARPSELENRVLAILDDRVRRPGPGGRRVGLLALAVLLLPVASIQPAAANGRVTADDPSPPATDTRGAYPETPMDADGADEKLGSAAAADPRLTGDGHADVGPTDDAKRAAPGLRPETGDAVATDTIEERVLRALARALETGDAATRRQVAHTLGSIESPRGVEPLARLVREDPDASVRRTAVWALGMIESTDGVTPAAAALADEDAGVRKEAAWALGMIESPDGVTPLLPLLEDDSPVIRKEAAWALGMIESTEAVDALRRAFGSEEVADVRAEMIWALGMIEDRTAAETLVDALEDPDPDVRKQALWALGMVMD